MNLYNAQNRRGYKGSVNNDPSMTVPNQVKSLQEMLDRLSRGFPLNTNPRLVWGEDEEEVINMTDLTDLDDAQAYIEQVRHKTVYEKEKASKRTKTSEEGNDEQNAAK